MNLFKYKGRYLTGDKAKGVIAAVSVEEVIRVLQARGIFVRPKDVKKVRFSIRSILPLTSGDWHFIFSSLAKLVGKVPPQEAVQILIEDQINPKVAFFLLKVREYMEEGLLLSQAFERAGAPKEVVDIISVGEKSGRLLEVLNVLSEIYGELKGIKKELLTALIPPGVILAILGLIMFFMVPSVLSQFGQIIGSVISGYKLPTLTVFVIKAGKNLPKITFAFFVSLPVLILGLVTLYRRSLSFKKAVDKLVLSFPVAGKGFLALHLYRSFTTFYVLYRSGFPIREALESILDGTNNFYLKRAWQVVYDSHVRQSINLARAFSYHPFIPAPVKNMITIGTRTGELADRLKDAIGYLKDRFYAYSSYVKGTITPVLFVISFVIVAAVLIAIALPIFKLMTQLQNLH